MEFDPLMRLFKTDILSKKFKDNYLIDILENFVLERGIYGKRWLDENILILSNLEKWG